MHLAIDEPDDQAHSLLSEVVVQYRSLRTGTGDAPNP